MGKQIDELTEFTSVRGDMLIPLVDLTLGSAGSGYAQVNDVLTNTLLYPTEVGELGVTNNRYPRGDPRRYGALVDAVTIDTVGFQAALVAAGVGLATFPSGTALVNALSTLVSSKINAAGSALKAASNNIIVLTLTPGNGYAGPDNQVIRDLHISGLGKTGITGIKAVLAAGQALANLILENLNISDCDVVNLDLSNSQFVRTTGVTVSRGTGAGVYIKNVVTDGGGNSHDHYGLHAGYKEVGVLADGTNFGTGLVALNFYNPQLLANSVCGIALFNCSASIYGAANEVNATGAATVVINGKTVKRSSMYYNNARVLIDKFTIAESVANPVILAENSSVVTLRDVDGYALGSGLLVSCDATSGVILLGTHYAVGVVQNVIGWPSAWVLPATAQSVLYGEPVHTVDPALPVLYAEQASALVSAGGTPPTSNAFAEDVDLGYCRSVQFQTSIGTVSVNHVRMIVGAGGAAKDSVFSVLLKASVDCQFQFNFHDGAAFNGVNSGNINLKAGKVTKLIFGKRNIPAGTWTLYFFLADATGATVKFANLQVYQGATGAIGTTEEIAKIISNGAFNPGVVRESQVNLRLLAQGVNTMGKYPGKQVWDVTNNRVVFAAGSAVADVWKDGVNTTVHTPV